MISVITATWQRHDTLLNAIRSVQAQTFRDWEHIIICDGRDDALRDKLKDTHCRFVELGRNWHTASGGKNVGGVPKLVGNYLAQGDYITYLDDDNEYFPDHLQSLHDVMQSGDYDFAYGKMVIVSENGKFMSILGDGIARLGHIDTNMLMHKWELVRLANWKADIYADDWQLIETWLNHGARYGWIDKTTVRYCFHPKP